MPARFNVENTSRGMLTSAAPLSTAKFSVIAPFITTGTSKYAAATCERHVCSSQAGVSVGDFLCCRQGRAIRARIKRAGRCGWWIVIAAAPQFRESLMHYSTSALALFVATQKLRSLARSCDRVVVAAADLRGPVVGASGKYHLVLLGGPGFEQEQVSRLIQTQVPPTVSVS